MSYYKREYSSMEVKIIFLSLFIFIAIMFYFWQLQDIECSKSQDTCSLHTKTLFKKQTTQFKISDIEQYKITSRKACSKGGCHTSYYINIYLKSGKIIKLIQPIRNRCRAEEIYNNMVENDNFVIKGTYWNSLAPAFY